MRTAVWPSARSTRHPPWEAGSPVRTQAKGDPDWTFFRRWLSQPVHRCSCWHWRYRAQHWAAAAGSLRFLGWTVARELTQAAEARSIGAAAEHTALATAEPQARP